MSIQEVLQQRNAMLLEAERVRSDATYDADVEYAETLLKLRERYEHDLADANERRLCRVAPAHRAYNRAVVAAERRATPPAVVR